MYGLVTGDNSIMKHLMWIVTAASILGVILNIHKKRACFYIWTRTTITWYLTDFCSGAYPQSALFAIYTGLAIWGILQWRKKTFLEDTGYDGYVREMTQEELKVMSNAWTGSIGVIKNIVDKPIKGKSATMKILDDVEEET